MMLKRQIAKAMIKISSSRVRDLQHLAVGVRPEATAAPPPLAWFCIVLWETVTLHLVPTSPLPPSRTLEAAVVATGEEPPPPRKQVLFLAAVEEGEEQVVDNLLGSPPPACACWSSRRRSASLSALPPPSITVVFVSVGGCAVAKSLSFS